MKIQVVVVVVVIINYYHHYYDDDVVKLSVYTVSESNRGRKA